MQELIEKLKKYNLVYLAAPYTSDIANVTKQRVAAINQSAGYLMKNGITIYSPISHCHPIAQAGELPTDFEYWQNYLEVMLTKSDALLVLQLQGWEYSKGVQAEIRYMEWLRKPIHYIENLGETLNRESFAEWVQKANKEIAQRQNGRHGGTRTVGVFD